jgi:toxin HigB-1
MIKSFNSKETAKVWKGDFPKKLPESIQRKARLKLRMLHNSTSLDDLKIPPANRLEQLKGDREGQYSMRINSQWRICFMWNSGDATDVEIADYH